MQVMTVRGPISAQDLGVTLMHEHLVADSLCWRTHPQDDEEQIWAEAPLSMESLGLLRRNPLFMRDNLLLDNTQLASREALRFRNAGGQTIVETSCIGLGRNIRSLQTIAEETGLHVVAGCGFYVEIAHPTWVNTASVEALRDHIVQDILVGIDDTGIRAGIIGELGTSYTVTQSEERVLRAGALAQRQTGLAITVHMGGQAAEAIRVLDILEDAGADLTRVVLDHMDDDLTDMEMHARVAVRGAYVEYDGFGAEWYFDSLGTVTARDTDRIRAVLWLAERGHLDRLLLAQDIWLKQALRAYGGLGYDHILRSIVPALRREGLKDEDVQQLLVANPAAVLSGEA